MSIASYADLQNAVASWLHRTDLTPRIPDFIALAEADMRRRLRLKANTGRATAPIAAEYVALPADFTGMRLLSIGGITVRQVSPENLTCAVQANLPPGQPATFAIIGSEMRMHPIPDKSYSAEMVYYRSLVALSNSMATNWLLTAHPDAYLYGTLANSAPYLRDDARVALWAAAYNGAIQAIIDDDTEQLSSESRAPLRTDVPTRWSGYGLNATDPMQRFA